MTKTTTNATPSKALTIDAILAIAAAGHAVDPALLAAAQTLKAGGTIATGESKQDREARLKALPFHVSANAVNAKYPATIQVRGKYEDGRSLTPKSLGLRVAELILDNADAVRAEIERAKAEHADAGRDWSKAAGK